MHNSHPFKLKYHHHPCPHYCHKGGIPFFCQLINQSTYNNTCTSNTRSMIYHSPRMHHHLTASTLSWFNKGNNPGPTRIDSDTDRLAKEGHVDISCCAFETCNARDQVFCVEVLGVLRRWVFHWASAETPKKAYLNVKKKRSSCGQWTKTKNRFWLKMPKKGGVWMEKSTKNCRQSLIFQKSPAHKIMICVIALQMQWQAKANLWRRVTNNTKIDILWAVSKEKKEILLHYTLLLPKVVDVSISFSNYISWEETSSPIRRSASADRSSLWFLAQISSWTKAFRALETSGIYKLFQRFT